MVPIAARTDPILCNLSVPRGFVDRADSGPRVPTLGTDDAVWAGNDEL